MSFFKIFLILLFLIGAASCVKVSVFHLSNPSSSLERAEMLSRAGDYDGAIEAYRAHIEDRQKIENRPDWENPWFYLVLIGDIELGEDRPEEAIKTYEEAESKGVDIYLISDRARSVAKYYEKKGQLAKAIDILNRHREKDPMLMDSMLDRLSKELVRKEDSRI